MQTSRGNNSGSGYADPVRRLLTIGEAAVEAIDTIRAAFQRKSVDISIAGDEEDVEIAFGLRSERSTPAPTYQIGLARRPVGPARDLQREIPAAQRPGKAGRNDPCPCGSGKKYKKCCLK